MKKPYEIVHAWGRHCKNCKKIFSIEQSNCPICDMVMVRAVCAVQVPRGCVFVYDDGNVPGSQHWAEVSDEKYEMWLEADSHSRPGR
jgi:hypothetical protein